jgi:hypothetical protein
MRHWSETALAFKRGRIEDIASKIEGEILGGKVVGRSAEIGTLEQLLGSGVGQRATLVHVTALESGRRRSRRNRP